RSDVPGLGIAVVNDGKLDWARGYGVRRAKENEPVTAHTRFQAGPISQTVTALAALRLVQQKKLALDDDLNTQLVSWKVPDGVFTLQKHPTLRQALSHSAGFNLPDIALESGLPPTLLDTLDGAKGIGPVRLEDVPGMKLRESAGGYCVVQQLLMDVCGK